MGEKEEARVLARFQKEVDEHVSVIKVCVKKGEKPEAVLWVNELLAMKQEWELRSRRVSAMGVWVPGKAQINEVKLKNEAARLAAARVAIVSSAIKEAKALVESMP